MSVMKNETVSKLFHSTIPMPPGGQFCLERRRIDLLLEQALQNPVLTVVAGAGYGKTQAVYSFVRKYDVRTTWIQFSERDNNGSHFWENFISAVSVLSGESAEKLAEMSFPATEQQFERYLKIPRDDLMPNSKYIFVYDDVHLLTDKTVLRFLEHSITSYFPNITSILISRTEPPFKLDELRSKGLLARIDEEDLYFTQEEMDSYFRLFDITPSPQIAAAVYKDTEGWAFAIHLAGLSLKNIIKRNAETAGYVPSAIRPNIFKLLESEVMSRLSSELQHFLIKLSLVERLAPKLLDEIAGDPALIREMNEIASYIRFDTYLNAYRIHHLFLDYLKGRQGELSKKEKLDVWKKTAAWSAANNQKMDAASYYEKAGDYGGIVNILYTLPLILSTHMARFVLELMDRAPPDVCKKYPVLIILRSRTLISLGRFDQNRDELLAAIPLVRELPESPEKHRILTGCFINLGFCNFVSCMFTKRYGFIKYFRQAAVESRQMGSYVTRPPVNCFTLGSYVCRVMEPSPEAIEKYTTIVKKIVPYTVEAMGGCMSGFYELVKGELAFFRGEFDDGEQFLLEALKKGHARNQYEIENRALFYLLRMYISGAKLRGIEDVHRKLDAELREPLFLTRYAHYDIVTSWYNVQIGRIDRIAPWLKSGYKESDLNMRAHNLEKLVKAKYAIHEKRCPAAIAILQNRGEDEPFLIGSIEIKVLEAVCHYRLKEKEKAFRSLIEAYELAEPSGLFFPFVEQGKDMRNLAGAMLKEKNPLPGRDWLNKINREASSYAKKLFIVAEHNRAPKGDTGGEASLLSRREIEVLKGLSEGLTREEIAGVSSISINTVKSAVRSIFNKLGAVNRADAVRIAEEKNILRQE